MTTTTRERPILFSAPMVRAIIAGTKTQTRRVRRLELPNANPKTWALDILGRSSALFRCIRGYEPSGLVTARCPYGAAGDRLWVRETCFDNGDGEWIYRADGDFIEQFEMIEGDPRWRPSIHMPRRACRIVLELTEVRVQRLHDISEDDALAEGIEHCAPCYYPPTRDGSCEGAPDPQSTARSAFALLWDDVNGVGAWDANPFAWALTFKRVP